MLFDSANFVQTWTSAIWALAKQKYKRIQESTAQERSGRSWRRLNKQKFDSANTCRFLNACTFGARHSGSFDCRYLAKFSSLDHAALDSSPIWTQTNARVWYSNPATSCCHSECVSNAVWVQKWRIHNGKIHCARPANVMDPYLCESVHNSDGCLRYANTNRKTWTWHFLDVTSSLLNHLPITDLTTRGVRYLIFVSR